MRRGILKRLTARQKAELKALAMLPEHAIETRDVPQVVDWSNAVRGRFYGRIKQQKTRRAAIR